VASYTVNFLRFSEGGLRYDRSYKVLWTLPPKTLAERMHRCPNCGAELDRDYNASVNILKKGLTHLTGGRVGATRTYACGEGTGGIASREVVSQPSLKQETPCGSPG